MKVDWDKIISENHKPSRASRRLAKPKLVGGDFWSDIGSFFDSPGGQVFLALTGFDALVLPPRPGPPSQEQTYHDFPQPGDEGYNYNPALTTRAKAENWLLTSEIPKEMKQQEEEYRRGRENEARALLLRNEQNRKAEAARLLARQQATAAQNAARVQAAQQGATNAQGYLEKIKAVSAASAATRAQNLESLHTLATQRAAAAAAEAEQQKAIQANSAQVLAQQNTEVARLRAEAMAKQGQIAAPSAYMTVAARRGKAPQVKFGGLRYY
jgi:hypothetical protein